MANKRIELEDKGQDLLYFITDENGVIEEAGPYHNELYKGATIPLEMQEIGDLCMMHNPPHINYGYLQYKVESITEISE
ncbi:MAG: hypothetical protein ABFD50_14445 [Smithella sp.]